MKRYQVPLRGKKFFFDFFQLIHNTGGQPLLTALVGNFYYHCNYLYSLQKKKLEKLHQN